MGETSDEDERLTNGLLILRQGRRTGGGLDKLYEEYPDDGGGEFGKLYPGPPYVDGADENCEGPCKKFLDCDMAAM